MSWRLFFLFLCGLGCLVGVSYGEDVNLDVTTITGFNVPEYDRDGRLKSQVFGDMAEVMPDNTVRITNLRIEGYKEGVVFMELTSPLCVYDQNTKIATSESAVRIEQEKVVVTGTGFDWDSTREKMLIKSNVQVILRNVKDDIDQRVGR